MLVCNVTEPKHEGYTTENTMQLCLSHNHSEKLGLHTYVG